MTKNIFNWNHISDDLNENQISELKALYKCYHRLFKCYSSIGDGGFRASPILRPMVSTFCARIFALTFWQLNLDKYFGKLYVSGYGIHRMVSTFCAHILRSHFGNYMFFQLKVRLKKVLQPNHPYNYLNPSNGFHILR